MMITGENGGPARSHSKESRKILRKMTSTMQIPWGILSDIGGEGGRARVLVTHRKDYEENEKDATAVFP